MTNERDGSAGRVDPERSAALYREMERQGLGDADDPRTAAQALVYDAWEAETDEEALELVDEALELNPKNADANLMILDTVALPPAAEIEHLKRIVAIAAEDLGEECFKQKKGEFWGLVETRPYMRARARLAGLLLAVERLDEAIDECEALLELNPADNQGIRHSLLGAYLTTGELDRVRALFERYPDDCGSSAVFAWGRVLERFLAGTREEARAALEAARGVNGYVSAYLRGHRSLPKDRPGNYSPGSREEAVLCVDELLPAWERHPEAVEWLNQEERR